MGSRVFLLAASAVVAAAGALACGGSKQQPVVKRPATYVPVATATPIEFPVASAGNDDPVWDFVRSWQGAYFSPLLRPGFLPTGFDTVTTGNSVRPDPYTLFVVYSGPGASLKIEAGGLNASEAYQDGTQVPVTVRGHDAALEVNRGGDPRDGLVVWWREPGSWTSDVGQPPYNYVDYALVAVGLTKDQALQVANALTEMR